MLSRGSLRGAPALLLPLAFMSTLWQHVHGLSQTYCSSSNTGSDYDAGQQFFRIATTCMPAC